MVTFGTPLAYAGRMAYLPRYEIICDDAYFHVTWQCHNKDWLLQWDWAKKAYYDLLLKYKDKYGIEIYAYNFMDNHPHLTGHLQIKENLSALLRLVNSRFARCASEYPGIAGATPVALFIFSNPATLV